MLMRMSVTVSYAVARRLNAPAGLFFFRPPSASYFRLHLAKRAAFFGLGRGGRHAVLNHLKVEPGELILAIDFEALADGQAPFSVQIGVGDRAFAVGNVVVDVALHGESFFAKMDWR